MTRHDHGIPLDEAELLSVLLEGILYGFSLLMFRGTVWVLLSRRSTHQVNHKMFAVAYLLLMFSTMYTAPRDSYPKDHGWFDIVPRHLPRRTYRIFLSEWITSFWALALVTNLLTILLLVFRIWNVDRKATRLRDHQKSQLQPILHILIDAGVIYSLTLFAALICFVSQTNGQYVILDMVTPIISVTLYMVIIRVGLATLTNRLASIPLGTTSTDHSLGAERRRRIQVHITTLTKSNVHSSESLTSPIGSKNRPSEIKFENIEEAVWTVEGTS